MNIALYLRLSESDGDLGVDGKNESNSIENQRLLLLSFIEAREDLEGEVSEYIDDGFSGTNFNRPSFKRMLEDAKKKLIDLIVVKDLSRLGRDYIMAGDYIEQIFPMLGVRFIAVNNNYDSDKLTNATMGFDMAINNLINTMYSRDLSKKMKSANLTRWQIGICTSGGAPFGYIKDAENKGKWKIDTDAAKIVRIIFEKALKGMKSSQIASYLNEQGFPTPWVYNQTHKNWKLGDLKTKDTERLWDSTKVTTIIKRYEYTGALVMGRRKSLSVGSRKVRVQPADCWTVVDDINEAIVSKEVFGQAQEAIVFRRKAEYIIEQNYLLKGLVRCGNCGLCLQYNGAGYEETFSCSHGKSIGKHSACCKENYSMKQIEGYVFHSLKLLFALLIDGGEKMVEQEREQISITKAELSRITKTIEGLREDKIRQYEAYANGVITREIYIKKKQNIDREIEHLEQYMVEKKSDISEDDESYAVLNEVVASAKKFYSMEKLSREMLVTFIDTVYVYDNKTFEIVYKNDELLQEIHERCA